MSSTTEFIAHWDDVEGRRSELGHLGAVWRDLGRAAGTVTVGLKRLEIDPGKWSTPAHVEGAEEEIVYVLGGSGLSWQDGKVYEIGPGDCIVHPPSAWAHTLRAGDDGLDVLIYGTRVPLQIADLPRGDVAWIFPTWTDAGTGDHPWAREVAAGEPEVGEPEPRPPNILNAKDVEWEDWVAGAGVRHHVRLARAASRRDADRAEHRPNPSRQAQHRPHVPLRRGGVFRRARRGRVVPPSARRSIRSGRATSSRARPGTRSGIASEAATAAWSYLLYGTRDRTTSASTRDSNKLFFRGLGVITRIEQLDYMDGEL